MLNLASPLYRRFLFTEEEREHTFAALGVSSARADTSKETEADIVRGRG